MTVYGVQDTHKENLVALYRSQVEGSHCEGFILIEYVCLKQVVSNIYRKITGCPSGILSCRT